MAHFDHNRFAEYRLRKQALFGFDKAVDYGKSGIALLHALGIGGAIAAGYGISRATSPEHISDNSDLEVVKNNLMTEIATVERQVEEEKKKFEAEKKAAKERLPYDKFLSGK